MIVPSWRRAEALDRCLEALAAQQRRADEVLVVARADDEPTRALLERWQGRLEGLRPVPVERPGVVAALGAGLGAARGAVVAITDDDARPRAGWLAGLLAAYAGGQDLGAVGGRDHIADEDGTAAVVGVVRPWGRLVHDHHLGTGPARDVAFLKGVNLSVRRAALEGFRLDERLRGEGAQPHWELDLCLALRRRGWRLRYDPAIAVDHDPAPRGDAQFRGRPGTAALRDGVHNEVLACLRWLPRRRALAVLAYGLLVGSREAPGLVAAVERLARGEDPRAVLRRAAAAERSRLEAVATLAAGA